MTSEERVQHPEFTPDDVLREDCREAYELLWLNVSEVPSWVLAGRMG